MSRHGGNFLLGIVPITITKYQVQSFPFFFAGENNNPIGEPVSKPGEEATSNFISTESTTGNYRVEELDPQPQRLVEEILNEKPLLNKLQSETDQEYIANNQGNLPGADMYLHHNTNSDLVEPKYSILESIKRSRISHKLNLNNNRTSNENTTAMRSIKRDIGEDNDVLNKKAKVKLKRALMKHLKKLSHKSIK